MSELPGLPAFGPEPVFVADDVAFDGVVARAVTRRRRRGTATFSTCVATCVTAVALVSSGDYGRTSLQPAIRTPAPTTTPTPAVTREPTNDGIHAVPLVVRTTRPASAPDPQWGLNVETVPDAAPGRDCSDDTMSEGWCFRYRGPEGAASGAFVEFSAELCRLPEGTSEPRVKFDNEVELSLLVADPARVPGRYAEIPDGEFRSHTTTFEAGTCQRWTAQWNGISEAGASLPPGTYDIHVLVHGYVPSPPVPGQTQEPPHLAFGYDGEFVVT